MGVFKARETGGESTDCQSETEEAGRTINRFDQRHQGHQDDQEIVLFLSSSSLSHSSSAGKGCSRSHPQPSHRRPKEELTVPKVHQSRQGSPLVTFGSSEMAAQPPMMEVEAVNQEEGPENLDGGSRTRGGTPSSLGSTTGCWRGWRRSRRRGTCWCAASRLSRGRKSGTTSSWPRWWKDTKTNNKRKQRERTMISGAREDAKSWSARRKPPRTRASWFHRGSQGAAPFSKRKVGNITLSLRLGSHLMQVSKCSLSQHGHVDCCE